jgi:hypothetical protein
MLPTLGRRGLCYSAFSFFEVILDIAFSQLLKETRLAQFDPDLCTKSTVSPESLQYDSRFWLQYESSHPWPYEVLQASLAVLVSYLPRFESKYQNVKKVSMDLQTALSYSPNLFMLLSFLVLGIVEVLLLYYHACVV